MNDHGWSADDIASLRRLVAAGWTDPRIGKALDRARASVRRPTARLKSRRLP